MQPEFTPTEARGGGVTGRVLTILIISFIGAAGAWRWPGTSSPSKLSS